MTVAELIQHLKTYPPDRDVVVEYDGGVRGVQATKIAKISEVIGPWQDRWSDTDDNLVVIE